MKIGDKITAYKKGICKVVGITKRYYIKGFNKSHFYTISETNDNFNINNTDGEYTSLIDYIITHTEEGVEKNSKIIECCDESFCKSLENKILELKEIISKLEQINK